MMPNDPQTTVAQEAVANYWPLLIPAAVPLLCLLALAIGSRWPGLLDAWLRASQRNRRLFAGLGLFSAAIAAIVARLPDFSAIQNGIVSPKDTWLLGALLLSTFVGVWVQLVNLKLADSWNERLDREKRLVAETIAAATAGQQEAFFNDWVSRCFLRAIGAKRTHLNDAASAIVRLDSAHDTIRHYYQAANPRRQVAALVNVVYDIYFEMLPDTNPKPKMRVTYFHVQDGSLAACHCWDGLCNSCLKTTPKNLKKKLRLVKTNVRHLAVAAAYSGEIEIVENAEIADQDENIPFRFFGPGQKNRIQSMVAIPLGDPGDLDYHSHVVCIDTTSPGFFQENQRDRLELVKQNLEQRLLCELAMDAILSPAATGKKRA